VNESGITAYFELVRLTPLLKRTRGAPEIKIGPIAVDHPDLTIDSIQKVFPTEELPFLHTKLSPYFDRRDWRFLEWEAKRATNLNFDRSRSRR
jgi:hypothetical protein